MSTQFGYLASMFDEKPLESHIKKERAIARQLRKTNWWLRKADNDPCYYCGQKPSPGSVTMDHIHPISSGGKSSKGNIVVACKNCNNEKKDQSIFDYLKLT